MNARRTLCLIVGVLVASGCIERSNPVEWRIDSPAFALLLGDTYTDLEVHIHYVGGLRPNQEAVSVLHATLNETLQKDRIRIVLDSRPTFRFPESYTMAEIGDVALRRFADDLDVHPPIYVVHVVYANGIPTDNEEVIAWYQPPVEHTAPPLIFMLKERWLTPTGRMLAEFGDERVERAVLVHEFGHAMGLVNFSIPMVTPREDPEYPHHSANPGSVMYSGVRILPRLLEYVADNTAIPYKFDSDDLADLSAFQSHYPN